MKHEDALRELRRNPDARITIDDPYENRVNPGPDETVPSDMAQERRDAMRAARGLVAAFAIASAFVAFGLAVRWLLSVLAR